MRRWFTIVALALVGSAFADEDDDMGRRLQEELRAHGGDVHGCYGVALAETPGLAGELLVRLVVAPGGGVERVEILKDQVGSGRLADCLVGAMRRWQVPKLAGSASQQVVFPLAFHPDQVAATQQAPPAYVVHAGDGKPGPLPGGKLEARVLIAPSTVGKTTASLVLLDLPPSARLALHQHPKAAELLYVVKGRAHLRGATGAPTSAEAGDLIVALGGAAHSVEAAPLAPLTLVQVFVPPGPEHGYLDAKDRGGTLPAKKAAGAAAAVQPRVAHAAALKAYPILGGKGAATLFLDDDTAAGASLQRLDADAGAEVPPHQHDGADEILYILAGRGEMTVAGQKIPVAAGDAVHLPAATQHSLSVS